MEMAFERPDDSISFLEKVASVQRLQHDLETRRMALDRQLNTRVARVDLKMAKQRSQRLEQYYQKICEDERRAKIRNEKIREDLARAETRLQWMSQRSDRFKALKDEYEKMVEREYPGWLQQLASFQKLKEQNEVMPAVPSSTLTLGAWQQAPFTSTFVLPAGPPPQNPAQGLATIIPSAHPPYHSSYPVSSYPTTHVSSKLPSTLSSTATVSYPNQQQLNQQQHYQQQQQQHFKQQQHYQQQQNQFHQQQQQQQLHSFARVSTSSHPEYLPKSISASAAQLLPDIASLCHGQDSVPPNLQHQYNAEADADTPTLRTPEQNSRHPPPSGFHHMPEQDQNFKHPERREAEAPSDPQQQQRPPLLDQRRTNAQPSHQAQPISQQPSAGHQRTKNVLKEYQKTLERADAASSADRARSEEADEAEEDDRTDRPESEDSHRNSTKEEVKETTVARERAETPKKPGQTNDHSSPEEKRRVISIPSANTEDDDDDDGDDDGDRDSEESGGERNAGFHSTGASGSPPPPPPPPPPLQPDSSFKPNAGGDLAGTLDMLDSSLGSVDSASLPEMPMSPVQSASASGGNGRNKGRSSGGGGGGDFPRDETSRMSDQYASAKNKASVVAAASSPKKKEKSTPPREVSRVGRRGRSEEEEDDDIFEREEIKDAKVKEDANLAYQRMMTTMKSESSTSRAVNTNKALDSSSEDELENAIQKAVMGNKVKKEASGPSTALKSPPAAAANANVASAASSSLGSKSPSSFSASPTRSNSNRDAKPSAAVNPPAKQQKQQSHPAKSYQPKKATTNFGMFAVASKGKPGSAGAGRPPPHLRHAGSDSELDDASSDGGGKSKGGAKDGTDDDFDFYG